jgi:hypothetical protein
MEPNSDERWAEVLEAVKAFVNASPDANLDNGELCRNTWECYAFCRWTNNPYAGLYEDSFVDPACAAVCRELSDSEVEMLLERQWDEFLENWDPGVRSPRQMSPEARRAALVSVLEEAVYLEAGIDGAVVEERQWTGSEADQDDMSPSE